MFIKDLQKKPSQRNEVKKTNNNYVVVMYSYFTSK